MSIFSASKKDCLISLYSWHFQKMWSVVPLALAGLAFASVAADEPRSVQSVGSSDTSADDALEWPVELWIAAVDELELVVLVVFIALLWRVP